MKSTVRIRINFISEIKLLKENHSLGKFNEQTYRGPPTERLLRYDEERWLQPQLLRLSENSAGLLGLLCMYGVWLTRNKS